LQLLQALLEAPLQLLQALLEALLQLLQALLQAPGASRAPGHARQAPAWEAVKASKLLQALLHLALLQVALLQVALLQVALLQLPSAWRAAPQAASV
jgi:hypothetical protein